MEQRELYRSRAADREAQRQRLDGRAARIATARVLVALAVIALVGALVWAHLSPTAWWGVAALVALFVGLVVAHAQVFEKRARAQAAVRFFERGLGRLDETWRSSPSDGARFRQGDRPYAEDLDVFGKGSLFQLVDGTETRHGEEHLAALLAGEALGEYPTAIAARQQAIKDLAPRLDFREGLSVAGHRLGRRRPDPARFIAWAQAPRALPKSMALEITTFVLPAIVVALLVFAPELHVPRTFVLPFLAGELLLLWSLGAKLTPTLTAVSQEEHGFASYGEMIALVEREPFEAPLLRDLQRRLAATGHKATEEMAKLGRITGFLEARNNEVFRIFIAPVLLWDVRCALALETWRERAGKAVADWLEVVGEVEALGSFAALASERPAYAFAELAAEAQLVARDLGHPLIAEARRVSNDVTLAGPGSVLVVTGSNMSGKSTLLRAMGINAVLALAGAPVAAKSLRIGPLRVATSMRIRDSLDAGVSHFYAEVSALKRVLDQAKAPPAVLFLLDEILHGTNSRERLIGARTVVAELVARGALGAVSTHDLGLSDLEDRLPGRARNVHFQEQVEGDKMTFDYQLRPGIVQSSNALRLMRMVGIDVPLDASPDAAE